jgi:hypothetical protein
MKNFFCLLITVSVLSFSSLKADDKCSKVDGSYKKTCSSCECKNGVLNCTCATGQVTRQLFPPVQPARAATQPSSLDLNKFSDIYLTSIVNLKGTLFVNRNGEFIR